MFVTNVESPMQMWPPWNVGCVIVCLVWTNHCGNTARVTTQPDNWLTCLLSKPKQEVKFNVDDHEDGETLQFNALPWLRYPSAMLFVI